MTTLKSGKEVADIQFENSMLKCASGTQNMIQDCSYPAIPYISGELITITVFTVQALASR